MLNSRFGFVMIVGLFLTLGAVVVEGGEVSGELKRWHRVTVTFDGPRSGEDAASNPFMDYRLDVVFKQGERSIRVAGFFAADGEAGESGATEGNQWRVHFAPPRAGEWEYAASMRKGKGVAIKRGKEAGQAVKLAGAKGVIQIAATDKTGDDFRGKGALRYVGERYLRFAGSKEYFLKGGADSPENFLAYEGFDGTTIGERKKARPGENTNGAKLHVYGPHVRDWKAGDPTWRGGKGKGMIGALNYLASEGVNSVYFLTMNVIGDGKDVWPWTGYDERWRFDCSKLDQWEVVFSHMTAKGIQLHAITQETENDQLLDGGELGPERKLYYRELIARFAHHPAVVWNLGEENTNTTEQVKAFCDYIKAVDPYNHPIVIHTYPNKTEEVYGPLLGHKTLDGLSVQTNIDTSVIHGQVIEWVGQSEKAGRTWMVAHDEPGSAQLGVDHDAKDAAENNQDRMRHEALWGNLMAGGAGVEWYFGYKNPHSDLNCEDFRSRDRMWDYTRYAIEFFQEYLSFAEMGSADELCAADGAYCLAKAGETYAVYLPAGVKTSTLDLQGAGGAYEVRWYNPREGGGLRRGSVDTIQGAGVQSLGSAPAGGEGDWAVLVTKRK